MNTALIVEDDTDQAELVAELVQIRDLRPLVARNGREGLRMARAHRPAIVLLDLMLPDVDGFDVCRRLRGDPRTLATPIVMVTACNGRADRKRGFRVGANAYVTKPYDAADLFEAIDAARSWRAAIDRARIAGEIRVELNSETEFLQEVNEFLTRLYRLTPLADDQIAQLRQAVMEMGQNAIEWGNRHQSDELVELIYRVYSDRVEIVVRDQGPGFDPSDLPHAATADNPLSHLDVREKLGLREGGFGLLIARGMLDELRYNDWGNEVTLVQRFPARDRRASCASPARGQARA